MGRGTREQLAALAKRGLAPEGYHGLIGELDRLKGPITEASRVWIAANALTMYGNLMGRKAFLKIGPKRHHGNLSIVGVGDTSDSKGQGTDEAGEVFDLVDPDRPVLGGLATGQGVIYSVRDPRPHPTDPTKDDAGASEKRALCLEEEFSSLLARCTEKNAILSQTIRKAWDGSKLENVTMNNRIVATGHTISVIGHITPAELVGSLTHTYQADGFGNRLQFYYVTRQRLIAVPQPANSAKLKALADKFRDALDWLDGQEVEVINGKPEARAEFYFDAPTHIEYEIAYPRLRRKRHGLFGMLTARAATQVIKMALIYAAMDKSRAIRVEHLFAAKAVWEYVETSTKLLFDDTTGDPLADQCRGWLRKAGAAGISISALNEANGNRADGIRDALELLREQEIAYGTKIKGKSGPAVETWHLVDLPKPPTSTQRRIVSVADATGITKPADHIGGPETRWSAPVVELDPIIGGKVQKLR